MSSKDRLIQGLELVQAAMLSPNAFENSKESTFSALRRGCLDLRRDVGQMESEDFSHDQIEYAWLFLMELSRAKLRRKHALECISVMLMSPRWVHVLRTSDKVKQKLGTISVDMQIALGFSQHQQSSPVIGPSTAKLPVAGGSPVLTAIHRKGSSLVIPPPLSAKTSKIKKSVSSSSSRIIEEIPELAESSKDKPDLSVDATVQPERVQSAVVEELSVHSETPSGPGRKPVDLEGADSVLSSVNELNPFRIDFNPFKEFRGKKQSSKSVLSKSVDNRTDWWNGGVVSKNPPGPSIPAAWWM